MRRFGLVLVLAGLLLVPACSFDTSGIGPSGSNNNQVNQNNNNTSSNCGNGVQDPGETCDDHNLAPGDGCGVDCLIELGYSCTGWPSVCEPFCGDGIIIDPAEECDDGAQFPNDGCSIDCQEEEGYDCVGEPSVCTAICGDGDIAMGVEFCDDGNTNSGDGCDQNCQVEPGWNCSGEPSTCTESCGDGIVNFGEVCDDGGIDPCQGNCAADCSRFGPLCGDGFTECLEFCDDGNTDPCVGGCSAGCVRWAHVCGDGYVECGEYCDDNNTDACSGPCSADCTRDADVCGDGFQECGEQCDDGNNLPCNGACAADCLRPAAVCNDGIRECGEPCDGNDFGTATCDSETGSTAPLGNLTCNNCTIDTGSCLPGCTQHSHCPPGQQCDGSNNCVSVGNTCNDSPFVLDTTNTYQHTLENLEDNYNGGNNNGLDCQGFDFADAEGGDRVYEIPMSIGDYISIWVGPTTDWNPVLFLTKTCPVTNCIRGRDDAEYDPGRERIDYVASDNDTIYLVVDGNDNFGPYQLDVTRGTSSDWTTPSTTDPGDIIITELLNNPHGSNTINNNCEWFEIYNTHSTRAFNLDGVSFTQTPAGGSFTIGQPLFIEPGQYMVIARYTTLNWNCGLDWVSWSYKGNAFNLRYNSDCQVEISFSGNQLDYFSYTNSGWPYSDAHSMYLCNNHLNHSDNDSSNNWAETPHQPQYAYSGGGYTNYATPGDSNPGDCP